jgi:mannose-6-phosphate isomerase
MDHGLYRLVGRIQNYVWGGHEFIPELLGLHPESHTPYAEYWLGAHNKAPSKVILRDDRAVHLDRLIDEHPEKVLGPHVAHKYGRLPYLLKVLDVEEPLSIQVHPTKREAEAGFVRENELGIPLDSPKRNYKDDNHKPELMVALSDFWLLHGFLPEAQISEVLRDIPEFQGLLGVMEKGGSAELYHHVMTLPADKVNAILRPLVKRVRREGQSDGWEKASPEFWVVRAAAEEKPGQYDRGLFSIYFFNLVRLRAGQAIFQDAGIPHAYLRGQNIEVMANSDNVLRGGLTGKHVDVPELLRTVSFEGISPAVIEGTRTDSLFEALYQSPTEDFRLSRIDLRKGDTYVNSAESVEIVLVMAGAAAMGSDGKRLHLGRGRSAVVVSGTDYRITADSEDVTLFRVSLP